MKSIPHPFARLFPPPTQPPFLWLKHRSNLKRVPDGGTREVLISILIPSLPNAPFTGPPLNHGLDSTITGWQHHSMKNHRAIARELRWTHLPGTPRARSGRR